MAPAASAPTHPERDPWLAVVGCGKWGRNHVSTAAAMGALLAVVDARPAAREEAASHAARLCGAEIGCYASLEALVAQRPDGLRAVVVATPPATHAAVAERALAAGLSVLVEKPMCDSVEDARRLAAAAARAAPACKVLVGHLLRHGAPHARAMQLVREGRVGAVRRVKATRANFGTVRTAENALWSLCPHDVSVVLEMCGGGGGGRDALPTRVRCWGQNFAAGNGGLEDCVDVSMEFAGGAQAQIEANWLSPRKERRMAVYGDKGFIAVNEAVDGSTLDPVQAWTWDSAVSADGQSVSVRKVEIEAHPDPRRPPPPADWSPLRAELEHFADCCWEADRQPATDAEEGLRVVRVLAAATESMRSRDGAWVPLDPEPAPRDAPFFAHETAVVDAGARVGRGSKVWHFSHVMAGARVGDGCSLGQNVFVAGGAALGRNVRVQNNVSVYDGVTVGDDVFLGPGVVFTNVRAPRAAHPTDPAAYAATRVGRGATVGAGAVVVCGVAVGRCALVGAGAVVTRDVRAHALVVGNPARQVGWVGCTGRTLVAAGARGGELRCPGTGRVYRLLEDGELHGCEAAATAP